MKNQYQIRLYQFTDGTYLSLEQSDNSVITIEAFTRQDAIELAKEREQEDSEIPFLERVGVTKISETVSL